MRATTYEELVEMKSKQLLELAKALQIVGRHDMTKKVLVDAIVAAQTPATVIVEDEPSDLELELAKEVGADIKWEQLGRTHFDQSKSSYIDNAKIGQLIAFKVNDKRALSGMIEEIHGSGFVVKTKNGVRFPVRKKNVMWVKTGDRWPRGVYLALKGEQLNGANKAAN